MVIYSPTAVQPCVDRCHQGMTSTLMYFLKVIPAFPNAQVLTYPTNPPAQYCEGLFDLSECGHVTSEGFLSLLCGCF